MTSKLTKSNQEAKKNYLAQLKRNKDIPWELDTIKKIGQLWIKRNYARKFIVTDNFRPFTLKLYLGPHEKDICPPINFFLEEIEEVFSIFSHKGEVNETNISIPITKTTDTHSWNSFSHLYFIFPNLKTCEIIEEESTKIYTETKRVLICP